MSSNAIVEMDEGIKNKSVEKESDEPEEQRHPKINNQEEIFQRAVGSSSEKESDDIFTSTEEPRGSGEFFSCGRNNLLFVPGKRLSGLTGSKKLVKGL